VLIYHVKGTHAMPSVRFSEAEDDSAEDGRDMLLRA